MLEVMGKLSNWFSFSLQLLAQVKFYQQQISSTYIHLLQRSNENCEYVYCKVYEHSFELKQYKSKICKSIQNVFPQKLDNGNFENFASRTFVIPQSCLFSS
jgi:hypothetical protein